MKILYCKTYTYYIILSLLLIIGNGCKKGQFVGELESCNLSNIIKTTSDTKGTMYFNSSLNSYAIYVGIEGTYDSQDVGIVCNLPEKYKVDGQKIIFSGNYSKYDKVVQQQIPGQTYYNIELIRISTIDNLKK